MKKFISIFLLSITLISSVEANASILSLFDYISLKEDALYTTAKDEKDKIDVNNKTSNTNTKNGNSEDCSDRCGGSLLPGADCGCPDAVR